MLYEKAVHEVRKPSESALVSDGNITHQTLLERTFNSVGVIRIYVDRCITSHGSISELSETGGTRLAVTRQIDHRRVIIDDAAGRQGNWHL